MIKRVLMASAVLALSAALAQAQEVKIGLVAPFTGIGAELGQQIDRGVEQYLKLKADEFKPYKIKIIKRDDKNPSGADSKTAVQELLTQDNVDALAGWIYSPNAIASAPVVTAGKKLGVIMNAGTAHITTMSPMFVRTSFSMWHAGFALDRNTDLAHAGQRAEFRDAQLDRLSAELVEHDGGERLGESLEQCVIVTRTERTNPRDDRRVVDRVGELPGFERTRRRQADVHVDAHRLRELALPFVDADLRIEAQIVNEDLVHRGVRWALRSVGDTIPGHLT